MIERRFSFAHQTMGSRTVQNEPIVIDTEDLGEVHVGKLILPTEPLTRFASTKIFDTLSNSLNNPDNEDLRRNLTFSLTHNNPNSKSPIAHERAVSAYFTYDPNGETVIIEWGTIDPYSNQAKLHTFLNQAIDMQERAKQGMKLSSGHLARLIGTNQYLALFDELVKSREGSEIPPLKKTINTLHQHNIIPITADGYVRWPIFK